MHRFRCNVFRAAALVFEMLGVCVLCLGDHCGSGELERTLLQPHSGHDDRRSVYCEHRREVRLDLF